MRPRTHGMLLGLVLLSLVRPLAAQPLDPARSLFVTDRAVLDSAPGDLFTLQRVLDQLVAQAGSGQRTSLQLWQQWWDTFAMQPGLGLGAHCDSVVTAAGHPGLNGFPWQCPRREAQEATLNPFDPVGPVVYRTVALVNRFDLMPLTGAHCGEYRMVFARTPASGFPRNLLIFEAQLPNPTPRLGVEGCRPVAQFWAALSTLDDPAVRAQRLAAFYFTGLYGFPPVVSLGHYATGQIRTNSFIEPLWQLREFKLRGRRPVRLVPVPVADTPFGPLWNDARPVVKQGSFRRAVVRSLPGLLPDDVLTMAFQPASRFNAGQSNSQGPENDYPAQLAQGTGAVTQQLQQGLTALGSDLTPEEIARRAMTQSCAGCHQLSTAPPANALGHDVVWPRSLGFVQVNEDGEISPALRDVFLPHRQAVLEQFLAGRMSLRALAVTPGVEMTIGGPKHTH